MEETTVESRGSFRLIQIPVSLCYNETLYLTPKNGGII